jgi:hypothetical protein
MGTNRNGDGQSRPAVLIVGDTERAEMRPLFAWLKARSAGARRWVCIRDISDVSREFSQNEFPDLIVIFQSWSNEFSTTDVNWLFSFAPLARVIACYGAWCESDGRNWSIWPLSVRVPIWGAHRRIEREWQLVQNSGEASVLPLSASREEIFEADYAVTKSISQGFVAKGQRVLIDSPDPAYREFLIDECVEAGFVVTTETPSVLLIDIDPWGPARSLVLQTLIKKFPAATSLAITTFVQPSLEAELHDLGISNVVSKLAAHWNLAFQ